MLAKSQTKDYSSLYQQKNLGGRRSQIAPVSFCSAPHFLRDNIYQSTQVPAGGPPGAVGDARTNRVNILLKNKEYSAKVKAEKHAKKKVMLD